MYRGLAAVFFCISLFLPACRFDRSGHAPGTPWSDTRFDWPVDQAPYEQLPSDLGPEGASDGLGEPSLDSEVPTPDLSHDLTSDQNPKLDGPSREMGADFFPPDTLHPDLAAPDTLAPCAPQDCPLGCHDVTRCNRLMPSNLTQAAIEPTYSLALTDVQFPAGGTYVVNGETGLFGLARPAGTPGQAPGGVYWAVVSQSGAKGVGLFAVRSLSLPAGSTINVRGNLPVVIVAHDRIEVHGAIDASGFRSIPGPGGSRGGDGMGRAGETCGGGEGQGGSEDVVENEYGGGGGGGWGSAGGAGGDGWFERGGAGGRAGQTVLTNPLVPLRGGCGGGAGGSFTSGSGGGGGGALQLSATAAIEIHGSIRVAGGAGARGGQGGGGSGGGSGGSILLEARLVVAENLWSNGGGGGGGGDGTNGQDGTTSIFPAMGGTAGYGGGAGGGGGYGSVPAEAGRSGTVVGGGGGGGVGRIHIRSRDVLLANTRISPLATQSRALTLW